MRRSAEKTNTLVIDLATSAKLSSVANCVTADALGLLARSMTRMMTPNRKHQMMTSIVTGLYVLPLL